MARSSSASAAGATLVLFQATGGLSYLSQFIHLCACFDLSLCLCLSVSLFVCESLTLSLFFPPLFFPLITALWQPVVVLNACSLPERLSPQFSMAESERATLRCRRLNLQFETH